MRTGLRYGRRGGLLPMAVFLTQNAPGLRTSPVKRGYWVVRRVLGETIPPPPPMVPELPQDEAKLDLPLRDMLAQHRENPACASCHARFDSFGLAFEGYGPVGEKRDEGSGRTAGRYAGDFPRRQPGHRDSEGVQAYIREHRQNDFSTISAANCWSSRSAGRCCSPTNRSSSACKAKLARTVIASLPGGNDRHQSAVPEQTKHDPQNKRRLDPQEER